MEDKIILTRKQMARYDTLRKAIGSVITVKEAAEAMGLSERQITRLKKGVKGDRPKFCVNLHEGV
jgi:hypothetical protein